MKRAARRLLGILRLVAGLALVIYIVFVRGDWRVIEQFVSTAWVLPTLFSLALLGAGAEAARLRFLLRAQGIAVGLKSVYSLVLMSFFFGAFMPGGTGGDVAKLYYLASEYRGRTVEIVTALFADRLVGLFAMLVVTLGLALPNLEIIRQVPTIQALLLAVIVALAALLAVAALSCSTSLREWRPYVWLLSRAPLHRHLRRIDAAILSFRDHGRAVTGAVMLSCIGQIVLAFTFILIGSALVPGLSGTITGFLALLGMVANGLPLTPGGLGVGEAAFEALFAATGHDGGAGLMLAWRAGVLPLVVLGGLFYAFRRRSPEAGRERPRADGETTPFGIEP